MDNFCNNFSLAKVLIEIDFRPETADSSKAKRTCENQARIHQGTFVFLSKSLIIFFYFITASLNYCLIVVKNERFLLICLNHIKGISCICLVFDKLSSDFVRH